MMTSLCGGGSAKLETAGYDSTTSSGTGLTSHATPGTDGAYTQLKAATSNDWYSYTVILHYGSQSGRGIIDVAIGAGGAEFVVVSSIPYTSLGNAARDTSLSIWFPLHIAKGSRIAARIRRSDVASHQQRIMLLGQCGPALAVPPFTRATTYGTVLANARGTVIDPGGTANTLGANTEVVASTTNPIRALYVVAMKQDVVALAAFAMEAMEIYVGGSGSEQVLMPETVVWEASAVNDISYSLPIGPLFVDVPAGSRLSSKARCNNATSGAREGQLTLIGLD